MIRAALLSVMLTWACAGQPYSQISGQILDPSGAAVPGALISVLNQETGFRRTQDSQVDGTYVAASLGPGIYKIAVRKEGFRSVIRFGVRLEPLRQARVDFALAVGSMQEVITVESDAPHLAANGATLLTQFFGEEIERLPVNGRGWEGLLDLAPGVIITPATRGEAGQFTVNGQRPNTHYFTVDGVSANTGVSGGGLPAQSTGGALPGMSAIGSFHTLGSLDAMREFRVETAGETAELGRLPGAQISLISRAGASDFHGSLAHYFRHERLAANDWFANARAGARPPLRVNDFAYSLGGPVRRDRTFFFVAYEGLRLRQPFSWSAPVPSPAFRQSAPDWIQPALSAIPAANGAELGRGLAEWTGSNGRPSRLDSTSARLDHALTSRITLFARYSDSPSANEFGAIEINRLDLRAQSATLGVDLRPVRGLVLDTRVNGSSARARSLWRRADVAFDPCMLESVTANLIPTRTPCDYLVRIQVAGAGQFAFGPEGERRQTQLQVVQTAALDRRSHAVRVGIDYRRLAPQRQDALASASIIADNWDDLIAGRNLWSASAPARAMSMVLREVSAFAQDTWQITPRLTAVYGLRWEFSPPPQSSQPAVFLDRTTGDAQSLHQPIWRRRDTNFAPRLGFAYRIGNGTVIRAGAGVFYDSSLSLATDLVNGGPLALAQYGSNRAAPFSMLLSFGFMPDLRLPRVLEWNGSVEHALGGAGVLSIGYAGSSGDGLLRREIGGQGSRPTFLLALATNHGVSDYHGLQAQYRRSLARGLQMRVAYSWSHSLDNSSSDAALHWVGAGTRGSDWASSDFDARQTFAAAFTYQMERRGRLSGWALDGTLHARAGFPLTVLDSETFTGVNFANVFRPNLVGGVPIWVADAAAPAGRRLNRDAFQPAPNSAQGTLGRNAITGFGMAQLDLALRREFALGEKRALQFRMEAFNALNKANFADPERYLVNPLFGRSNSMLNLMLGTGSPASGLAPVFQSGGARSVQLSVRLRF